MKHAHAAPAFVGLSALLLATAFAHHASGECPYDWTPANEFPGVIGTVYCTTVWDPDGDGPEPDLLVVGGAFEVVGSANTRNLAVWDGSTWRALSQGPVGAIRALAVYNGELIAAGQFSHIGGQYIDRIARWNGAEWQPLPGGSVTGTPYTLLVYDGELVMGGQCWVYVGGGSIPNIAAWNGTRWRRFAHDGIGQIRNLFIYNNEIIALTDRAPARSGTVRMTVLRWDGETWQPLASGPPSLVSAAGVHDGRIWVGGERSPLYGFLASWDGKAWQTHSTTLRGYPLSLASYNGALHIGTSIYSTSSSTPFICAYRWIRDTQAPLGLGVNGPVQTMAVYRNSLVVAGGFSAAGGGGACNIASWDGAAWNSMGDGLSKRPVAFTKYKGELVAAGDFTAPGNVYSFSVSRRHHGSWVPMGAGFNAPVRALAEYNGDLIAGGMFRGEYGPSPELVSRWDGSTWQPMAAGLGEPWYNRSVYALQVYQGELIAGGEFYSSTEASGIAHWNGSTWQAYGYGTWGRVRALTVYRDELIAAGSFGSIDTTWTPNIIRWNGSTWRPLGDGITGEVYALAVLNDELYAAGYINSAGSVPVQNVARWDGNAWSAVGDRLYAVYSLAVLNGRLFAGGDLWSPNDWSSPTNAVGWWDGTIWQAMGDFRLPQIQTRQYVDALFVDDADLLVAGEFGGVYPQTSPYLVRWSPTVAPASIAKHPESQAVRFGTSATFSVTAGGQPPFKYQWRRKDQILVDDAHISGANTSNLTIHPVRPRDLGTYDVVVTNDCRSITSESAELASANRPVDPQPATPLSSRNQEDTR